MYVYAYMYIYDLWKQSKTALLHDAISTKYSQKALQSWPMRLKYGTSFLIVTKQL